MAQFSPNGNVLQEPWAAVDQYVTDLLVRPDAALNDAIQDSDAAGLPPINVAPNQGKFLHLLALAQGARRILEIGTLGGYSTIWLARALPPGGRLVTLEYEPLHADVARQNIARAGLSDVVDIRVGSALDTLPQLIAGGAGPFDFIFIDADKDNYPSYFELALKLSRPGTLMLADNTIRQGAVIDSKDTDPRVQGVRRFHELVAAETRVTATAVQTVGGKGYDGFTMVVVKDPAG